MENVTDIRATGSETNVLTEIGGGFLKRPLLEDDPLESYLDDTETPRYVLRNKGGVTVVRPDGTEEIEPVGRYSGLALVTDVRVVFAVGGRDGDRTVTVSLVDVVDVRVEEGRHATLVLETASDARYRFSCKGDLAPVREYLDAAVGVWARADRRVERAEERLADLRGAFESGDADVVLAAIGDVRGELESAREEAEALGGASDRIDDRAEAVATDLAGLERRAYAEQAEQARERAHVRWDDHDYEAALDHLVDAAAAYATAADIDADRPSDDLLERRRETLADERARLAAAPLDRAEHAADVAAAAEDPGAAVDWWTTAVERFETVLSLDWGRDERRFDGDPAELRDELTTAASNLVSAHCDLARDHIADGDEDSETDPESARAAYDRAADALSEARTVATERVPEAADEIDDVEARLEERISALSTPGESEPPESTVDPTAVDPEQFRELVATMFWWEGWTTKTVEAEDREYDLLAETADPVTLTACVWTFHPDTVAVVDETRIERCVASLDRSERGDAAVICSVSPLSSTARERAAECGVEVLDGDDIAERLAADDVAELQD